LIVASGSTTLASVTTLAVFAFLKPLIDGLLAAAVALLCAAGVALSCLSISGTWLVVAAAILAGLAWPRPFPGWWTIGAFVLLSAAVELLEAAASVWGVQRRGGSRAASLAAVGGGIVGFLAGTLIPIPVVGSLLGMMAGSFALVLAVERRRLKQTSAALHIAWGAVIARALVLVLKATVTLGMAVYLAAGLLLSR
jgi:uncharacterized protein YqgC (DUF456 family)